MFIETLGEYTVDHFHLSGMTRLTEGKMTFLATQHAAENM